jgi:hypothetical protein
MMNKLLLSNTECELVSSFSTDWSFVQYFKLPDKYRFVCRWTYTVDSYAGNRLYKYPETREVVQNATYISVTTLKNDGSLHEIKICDEDKVEILKRNITDTNTLLLYAMIINDVKAYYKKEE